MRSKHRQLQPERFNSILVRLKVGWAWYFALTSRSFNSILVRLKVARLVLPRVLRHGFNSILVRLKVIVFSPCPLWERCFNSILVRLKGLWPVFFEIRFFPRFNSILVRLKAVEITNWHCNSSSFQFHTGSIKRRHSIALLRSIMRFQFHTGSIKRDSELSEFNVFTTSFNSILVRLKEENDSEIQVLDKFQFHTGSIKSRTCLDR